MTWLLPLINDYGEARAARGVKASTIYGKSARLRLFAAWLLRCGVMDIHAVAPEHISGYQAHLLTILHRTKAGPQKLSPGYRHDLVASVCRFFKWLITARRIVIDPAAQIDLGRAEPHQPANVMTEAETVLLIDSTDGDSPILIRDRAILELLYSTGLRRAEIAALDLTDIDLADRTVLVRCGKGSKQRLVPMGDPAAEALVHYLTKLELSFSK